MREMTGGVTNGQNNEAKSTRRVPCEAATGRNLGKTEGCSIAEGNQQATQRREKENRRRQAGGGSLDKKAQPQLRGKRITAASFDK